MSTLVVSNQRRKNEFDKKLKQIESDEKKLKELEENLITLRRRMSEETTPLVQEFCKLRFENLTKLQEFLTDPSFKKKETRLLTQFLVQLAVGLQEAGDPRAEAILQKLIPEVEFENEEDENEKSHSHHFSQTLTKERSTEGKIEIKSLFRQLAKVFHPDKETQEHLKGEKTALMKKITAAYENQDLYGLLKIEKEHLGPREFSEDKIELYIQYINDRLKELKTFEASLKKRGPLAMIYKTIYNRKATLQEYNIRHELSKIEAEVQKEKELQNLIWDRSSLKQFLKS